MTREEKARRLEQIKSMPSGKDRNSAIKEFRKKLYLKLESHDPVKYQTPTDDRTSIETRMVQEAINSTPGALTVGALMAPLGVPAAVGGTIIGGIASSQALSPITSQYINKETVQGFKDDGMDGFHDALNGRVFNPETGQMEVPPNRISNAWGKAESISPPTKRGNALNATRAMLESGMK